MAIVADRIYSGLVKLDRLKRSTYRSRTKSLTASTILSCARARWYAIKSLRPDKEYEIDALTLSKFRDGNEAHIRLGVLFNDCGIKVVAREVNSNCRGVFVRIDYRVKIDGQDYNLEFKTMADGSFSTFLRYGLTAFPGYFAQCQLMAGSEPILPSVVLCKNKSSSGYSDELIKPDWEFIDNLVSLKEEFDRSVSLDTKPERPFDYDNPACAGCEYRVRCWFSRIRQDILLEKDLGENERNVIDALYKDLTDNSEAYSSYVRSEKELKNYIAFLHTKHSVSKVKLEGVNSSFVQTRTVKYDMPYILSLLTEEQLDRATGYRESKFFRTVLK